MRALPTVELTLRKQFTLVESGVLDAVVRPVTFAALYRARHEVEEVRAMPKNPPVVAFEKLPQDTPREASEVFKFLNLTI